MDSTRDQLLSGSRVAGYQYGRLHLRHRFNHLVKGLHLSGFADDVVEFAAGSLSLD